MKENKIRVKNLRLVLTNECNLKCFYCFNEGYEKNSESVSKLKIQDYLLVIKLLRDNYGLEKIKLTGGEPFLFPNIYTLIEGIVCQFPKLEIGITTNGALTHKIEKLLTREYSDKIKLNISIPSIDSNIFEKITGVNSLHKTLKSLELIKLSNHKKTAVDCVFAPKKFAKEPTKVIKYCENIGITVKLLCLNETPVNKDNLKKFDESKYSFKKATNFVESLGYSKETITQYSAIYKKGEHQVEVVKCNVADPLIYFSQFSSIRVFCDSTIAVNGFFDGFWRPLSLTNPEDSIEGLVIELEKNFSNTDKAFD